MIKKNAKGLILAVLIGFSVSTISAQLVVNEILINATTANNDGNNSPNTGEWTELLNNSSSPLDISCYVMTDGDWSVTFQPGTVLPPYGIITIGSLFSQIPELDINIANCNCTSGAPGEIGVFTNANEQIVIANNNGEIIDGIWWGNGQFGASFSTNSLFGCPSITIPILESNPNMEQVVGSIAEGVTAYLPCNESTVVGGNNNPSPDEPNFGPIQTIDPNSIVSNEICPNTGSVVLNPAGVGPFTFAWQDALVGNTSNEASGLTAGSWSVQITDVGQCNLTETFSFNILDQSSGCNPPDSSVLDGNSSVLLICSEGGSAYITDNGGANGNMTAQLGQSYQSLEICSDSWQVNTQMTLNNWAFNSNGLSGDLFLVYAGPFSEIQQYMGNNPQTLLTSPAALNVVFNSLNSPVGTDSTFVISDTCYTLITYHVPGFIPSPGFEATVTCIEPLSCLLDLSSIIVNDCDTANQIYSIDFDIVLNNTVNNTYDVALSLDGVAVDTVSVVSGEVLPYTMIAIPADAGANHVVSAEVIGSVGCNAEELYTSVDCLIECNTLAGTGITGPTTRLLCFGQNQNWSATGEVVPSADVNDPNVNYNPGMAWAIFTDMPSIFSGNVTADPAYAGIWPASISAIDGTYPFNFTNNTANGGAINNILSGNTGYPSPLHFYAAPITLYSVADTIVHVPGACSSIGDVVEITIVPSISYVLPTSSCLDGTVTYNPTQGDPAVNDNYFQLTGLTPNTVFATPIGNLTNGADLTIGGLVNGDIFSFTLTDTLGCAITINGGPFVGDQTPSSPGVPEICQSSDPVQLQATPEGGVWSGLGVDANGIFDPDLVGTFGSFTVTYTTSGDCGGSIDIVVPVLTNDNCVEGEVIGIGEPLVIACGGFLTDDGLQPSDYSPNSNDTSVVCPDPAYPLPQITALDFNVFDLGFGDQLSIYNGDNANATLIGTYTGADIQNQSFYSTDPSGCLTVVFTSDADASVGNFSAEISCGIPCLNPAVVVTTTEGPAPARICQQGEITFNASATEFFNDGIYESHIWEFGDGSVDTTSWPVVDHTFDAEGGYMVQLYVTDTNGCTNSVLIDYLVFVSTTPVIQLATSETDNKICTGVPLSLLSNYNEVNWSNVPTNPIDGFLFIPDDQSQCFSDTITFQGFPGSPVISSVNDIVDVFLNFEHSYMGDINITISCPDGSSVVMHNNGGGATLLGEPIDVDADLTPGVGYDYTWTPQSTNGTWVQNIGGTLPAGDYEPVEPFTNLLGCPINGDWILEICDVLGSDNGYVFDWNVHFPEEFYPDTISFTPVIGMACDSSYWTTSNNVVIANPGGDCDSIDVIVNAAVSNTYIYHVMDNHGCEYTDEITVEFYSAPVVELGPLTNYCNATLQLPNTPSGDPLTNAAQGITYSYTWTSDSIQFLSATNIANPTLNGLTPFVANAHQVQYNVLVTSNQDPECFASDSIYVNVPPLLVPGGVMVDTVLCQGDEFELNYPYAMLSNSYTYNWSFSPDLGQVDTVGYESSYTIPSLFTTTYTLEVTDQDCDYVDYYYYTVLGDPCTITTYNIFTPNSDPLALNNSFQIGGLFLCDENDNCVLKFPGSVLKVYNRWGTLVYENDNYDNTWTGEGLTEGTYYFVFLQNFENQDDKYFHGDVYFTR